MHSKQRCHRFRGNTVKLSTALTTSTKPCQLAALDARCNELQVANGLIRAKVNDLEGRSCRLTVRIVGIKEGEEKGSPTDFVSKLIPELQL